MGFDIWEDSLERSRDIPMLLPGKLAVCSEPLATELLPGPMGVVVSLPFDSPGVTAGQL